ncbi:hypothetical protein MTO96_015656 [Rhipicephalus appendiculatus]
MQSSFEYGEQLLGHENGLTPGLLDDEEVQRQEDQRPNSGPQHNRDDYAGYMMQEGLLVGHISETIRVSRMWFLAAVVEEMVEE